MHYSCYSYYCSYISCVDLYLIAWQSSAEYPNIFFNKVNEILLNMLDKKAVCQVQITHLMLYTQFEKSPHITIATFVI